MASTTILITPARRITTTTPALTTLQIPQSILQNDTHSSGGQPVRKRQRLTHLTPEEKLMRRKLKNRVAAQTARDRKKAHLTDIEVKLAEVEARNQQLLRANEELRKQTSSLVEENKKLKAQIRLQEDSTIAVKQEKDSLDVAVPMMDTGCESAVLKVPQQKEHIRALSSLMAVLILWSLSSCSVYSKTSTPKDSSQKRTETQPSSTTVQNTSVTPQILRWWGPQQANWNPLKN